MSLSITNHISKQEIAALAHCNLSSELIAIKMNAEGGPKIVTLSKSDVTCWQMFLRFFGWGNLAKTQVHLNDVVSHFNQFNWAAGATLDPHSEHNQAYLKTCMLANKALYSRWDETLLNNVASATIEKKMEFAHYQGFRLLDRHDAVRSFKWNSAMQIKHVRALLTKQFQSATIRIEDQHHHPISSNVNVSREVLDNARIYIEYRSLNPADPTVIAVPVHPPCNHSCQYYTRRRQ